MLMCPDQLVVVVVAVMDLALMNSTPANHVTIAKACITEVRNKT